MGTRLLRDRALVQLAQEEVEATARLLAVSEMSVRAAARARAAVIRLVADDAARLNAEMETDENINERTALVEAMGILFTIADDPQGDIAVRKDAEKIGLLLEAFLLRKACPWRRPTPPSPEKKG